MSTEKTINAKAIQQNIQQLPLGTLCKSIAISGFVVFLFYTFLFNPPYTQLYTHSFNLFKLQWPLSPTNNITNKDSSNIDTIKIEKTNLSHVVFGIVGSMNTWRHKRAYIEAWWRPNVSRGYLFLDRAPSREFIPWPITSPPFRVNEDISKFKVYPKIVRPVQVRIVRTILETFREGDKNVRWYVMADDDTVLFLDNIVELLAKYDHTKYYYIGTNSECVKSNFDFSFDMAFGGAGYALSFPLASKLARMLDGCIERYPFLYSSDFILHTCLADFGVALTRERGFHQIDLRADISGLLSSHPQQPILSLHHIDTINPIFPNKTRSQSIIHLMKATMADHSRVLQQTICYARQTNWTVSVSWGYSIHIYEKIHPRSYLIRPLETFKAWLKHFKPPFFMFNTRWPVNSSCEAPHVFYMDSIYNVKKRYSTHEVDYVVSSYARDGQRHLPPCPLGGNHSADSILKVIVYSPATSAKEAGVIECCHVEQSNNTNVVHVNLRTCFKEETLA